MESLRDIIADAERSERAVGHFNISDSNQLWGIFTAAREKEAPVIIGTSEGERDFIGARQAHALVKSIQEAFDYPIFINSDHCHSIESFQKAVDADYDAAIFDGAGMQLNFEENIAQTSEAVYYAQESQKDVLVEGELGYIGGSSTMRDEVPENAAVTPEQMTNAEEIREFVEQTGVDLMAPAVGNVHGIVKGGNPAIDIERIARLRDAGGVPLVLHGGSGITDEEFKQAITAGIAIVHVNTEIRVAYREGIAEALEQNPDEIAPYKYLDHAREQVAEVIRKKLELFGW